MVSAKATPASSGTANANRRLSDLAYDRILENLFERKLPAGAFVSQNHLVELLDIPVAPLRDALRVLEAEGVLKIHPRSGIEFVKPGLELTKSTYQFRAILERAAVRVFAETADESLIADIARMHADLVSRIEAEGLTDDSMAEIERLEGILHDNIIGILANPLIETSYKRMHNYLRLVRLDRRLTPPLALRSLREHIQIIDACKSRDADAAEAALQAHFNAALQRHMGLY
ncbi:GntR family transcriptional regulator [Pelagibacterium sp. 26DY04]|uniref:GntR family transcriptional regulator n=1 Tax=unclassified Pelagibacterium TaxID=2623280 RepID=UPI0028168B18|nr:MULTISPECIES: GntR family transcriptional regulator [unclassified Pelagibacterium]WMT85917.1 GntR family transcriptional regulator [Pelagibacterium sp. 26DY04]WMT89798.1 GntR family transcriptional regulator [Pelagibacterium sp. H642]